MEALVERIEPAEQIEEPADQVEDPTKQIEEPVEQVEDPTKQIEEPAQPIEQPQKRIYKRWKYLRNMKKIENCRKISGKPRKLVERIPPEPWTPCRLRQNKRELVLQKIAATAEEINSVDLELQRERCRKLKAKMQSQIEQHEDLPNICFVNVKQEQMVVDLEVKHEQETDLAIQVQCGKANGKKQEQQIVDMAVKHEQEMDLAIQVECVKAKAKQRKAITDNTKKIKKLKRKMQRMRCIQSELEKQIQLDKMHSNSTKRGRRLRVSLEENKLNKIRPSLGRPRGTKKQRSECARIAKLERYADETEEQRYKRIDREGRARKFASLKKKVAVIKQQLKRLRKALREMVEEEEDPSAENYFAAPPHDESEIKSSTTFLDTQMKKTTDDGLCNLLLFICRKQHSQQHISMKRFDNLCTPHTSNYILSTVIWHKLNGRNADGIDENFI